MHRCNRRPRRQNASKWMNNSAFVSHLPFLILCLFVLIACKRSWDETQQTAAWPSLPSTLSVASRAPSMWPCWTSAPRRLEWTPPCVRPSGWESQKATECLLSTMDLRDCPKDRYVPSYDSLIRVQKPLVAFLVTPGCQGETITRSPWWSSIYLMSNFSFFFSFGPD